MLQMVQPTSQLVLVLLDLASLRTVTSVASWRDCRRRLGENLNVDSAHDHSCGACVAAECSSTTQQTNESSKLAAACNQYLSFCETTIARDLCADRSQTTKE